MATSNNTAPNGTQTAATFTSTSSGSILVDQVANPSLYDEQTVTVSVYLRSRNGLGQLHLALVAADSSNYYRVAEQEVSLGGDWQRYSMTTPGSLPNGLQRLYLQIEGMNEAGDIFDVWGPQLVIGTAAAPYRPTGGGTGTINVTTGLPGTLIANGQNQTYAYDNFGNLLQNGNGFTDSYLPNNQMFGYAYDGVGRLLADGLGTTYTWDSQGQMTSAGGATYVYDAMGQRIEKQGVGVTDTIFFDGKPVARYSAGQWTDLIYGPSGLLAEVPGTQDGAPVYRVSDHLGSASASMLADGTLISPMDCTPFGQVFSGSTSDTYKFTGKERDAESGLDYFGARYYASSMGRFMSPDPLNLTD